MDDYIGSIRSEINELKRETLEQERKLWEDFRDKVSELRHQCKHERSDYCVITGIESCLDCGLEY